MSTSKPNMFEALQNSFEMDVYTKEQYKTWYDSGLQKAHKDGKLTKKQMETLKELAKNKMN